MAGVNLLQLVIVLLTLGAFAHGFKLEGVQQQPEHKSVEESRKGFETCKSSRDCSADHCCTVGMNRYSLPTCAPMGIKDESCIPYQTTQNFSLSYPDGSKIDVLEGYLILCPCGNEHSCEINDSGSSCQSISSKKNQINHDIDLE